MGTRAIGRALLLMGVIATVSSAKADAASSYCESRSGKVVVETSADGTKATSCVFPDGTKVATGAYFRSTHRTTK